MNDTENTRRFSRPGILVDADVSADGGPHRLFDQRTSRRRHPNTDRGFMAWERVDRRVVLAALASIIIFFLL